MVKIVKEDLKNSSSLSGFRTSIRVVQSNNKQTENQSIHKIDFMLSHYNRHD